MSGDNSLPAGRGAVNRPVEQEAVRTTIVGGRPPGCGQPVGKIPRGIEVLVKKAAVDPEFKTLFLERRATAATEIGLELEPAEAAMLAAVAGPQLETIIAHTVVPQELRRAFLGKAAAAMLAALGLVSSVGCPKGIAPDRPPTKGIAPDRPPATTGIAPDRPPAKDVVPDRPPTTEPPKEPAKVERELVKGIRPDRPEPDEKK